jgi:hypothetical protein
VFSALVEPRTSHNAGRYDNARTFIARGTRTRDVGAI